MRVAKFLSSNQIRKILRHKRALITLGSTREYLDPVRFITNGSSGKMGVEIAEALRFYGCQVHLIGGAGIRGAERFSLRTVVSARDMLKEVQKHFKNCDIFISAAAVADFRPKKTERFKIHRNGSDLLLRLVANPDILATVARRKKRQVCVGFALEDFRRFSHRAPESAIRRAQRKLAEKKCDLIVLNPADTIDSDFIGATILDASGNLVRLGKVTKRKCAQELCKAICRTLQEKNF